MKQPSTKKLVVYLWLTTIVLLFIFSQLKQLLGTTHMFAGEFLWIFIAPEIIGWLYRVKYKQSIPEDTAKKVANYFVASVMLLGLMAAGAYVAQNWSPRLSEQVTFLVIVISVYFLILWFLGRWAVSIGLNNYGRK